ncbi:U-Kazal-Dg21.2-like [Cochliomyia hominivorax]
MKYFSVIILALFFLCSVQAQCPEICPAIYLPVCGFNGRCYREFSNSCQMGVENCTQNQNFRQVSMKNCSKSGNRKC